MVPARVRLQVISDHSGAVRKSFPGQLPWLSVPTN